MILRRQGRVGRRWLLTAGAAVLAAACRSAPTPSSARPTNTPDLSPTTEVEYTVVRPVPSELRVGAALPLSGPHVEVGQAARVGYELAVHEINGLGGLLLSEYDRRVPVRLVVYDDQGHPPTSRQLLERLIEYDRVDALLGGYAGSTRLRTALAETRQIPYVTATESDAESHPAPGLHFVFGLQAPPARLPKTQLDWLASCQDRNLLPKPTRLALLWDAEPDGEAYAVEAQRRAASDAARFQVAMARSFDGASPSDVRTLPRDVRDAEVDVVLASVSLEACLVLQRQMATIQPAPRAMSYGFYGHQAAVRAQLGKAAEGLVTATPWSTALSSPESRTFAARFSAAYGREPRADHALAYGAAVTLFEAFVRAGSPAAARVRDALASPKDARTVLPGRAVTFTRDGLTELPMLLVQNGSNGLEQIVWPPSAQTASAVLAARP